jgi:hypothetical protein
VPRQDFGVSRRVAGRYAAGEQPLAGTGHDLPDRHHADVSAAVASFSFSELK